METSGLISRPAVCLHQTGVEESGRFSGELNFKKKTGDSSGVSLFKSKSHFKLLNSGFSDSKHVEYYRLSRIGGKKKEEKGCEDEMKRVKKKLKLMKRLSKDLSLFEDMSINVAESENSLMCEVKGRMILEAMEVLKAQLQFMKSEQKELKRKKKAEKKALKTAMMKTKPNCEESSASSSSSESSNSEGGEVIDMSCLRSDAFEQSEDGKQRQATIQEAALAQCRLLTQPDSLEIRDRSSAMVRSSEQKIEVCMGGKCKKMGAVALLEEFNKNVSLEGSVVGCKCMGKCRDGPNVRILNNQAGLQPEKNTQVSAKPKVSPLCIGVGLGDVSMIVAEFLGEDWSSKHVIAPA